MVFALSVDPLTKSYPWYTPYQFAGNNPILNIDLDGLEGVDYTRNMVKTHAGKPMFAKEDADNISKQIIYSYINYKDQTLEITHGKTVIEYNHSGAPTMLGIALYPGYYLALNIRSFSNEMLTFSRGLDSELTETTGYRGRQLNNGFINTFRHFAWQSTITLALGADIAKRVGDYHEKDGIEVQKGEFAKDNVIDLLNNHYAREYAKDFDFKEVTKDAESYANYLNGLAKHIVSTVDGYKDDAAFDSIRSGETKIFGAKNGGLKELYNSAKNLGKIK